MGLIIAPLIFIMACVICLGIHGIYANARIKKLIEKLHVLESSPENLEKLFCDMSSENKRLCFDNAVKDTVINNLREQNFKMAVVLNKYKITW